jgi:glycosyltransferase involved in cell wall biosynthesis
MLKVIHLQNSTESAGGVVPKLHNAFLESGIDSTILSLKPCANDINQIFHLGRFPNIIAKLENRLHSFLSRTNKEQFGLYSYSILGTNVSNNKQILDADIIYLHWIQGGFLNLRNVEQLAKLKKPIIFFMHDMWTITGGCHYSFSCEKYKSRCSECQVFSSHKKNDWSTKGFDRKLRLYSKYDNFYFVTPSRWLHDCVKQSPLTKNKSVFCIPNIVDISIFKPFDKIIAKQILNLNVNNPVIAFGAVSINSPYKGWGYFKRALEILKADSGFENITILLFGGDFNKQMANEIPFDIKYMGFLRDEYSMALLYNAADVFVAPSLTDNLPTTVLQSLGCGTPVVGFDIGGIPDMISHLSNGYLAKYKNPEDLSNGIKYCLNKKITGYMLPGFDINIIVRKHIELIDKIFS